jgi:protein-L-isoaspartate(D-aspartate) O-methyltransferase
MTTLAMIFGMVPLAFALTEGSEQRAPMGQAVIGGVITSSLLTLVVVPVVVLLPGRPGPVGKFGAATGPLRTGAAAGRPCRLLKWFICPEPFRENHEPPPSTRTRPLQHDRAADPPLGRAGHLDVLALLAVVKREDFVPAAQKVLAFVDMEIPLGTGAGQCMLAPKVEARILQELAVQKHEKVLEIGAGSGYMAALLAHRAQQVITLEIDPTLAQTARDNLQRAGLYNAEVRTGDGAAKIAQAVSSNDPLRGPFDVIVLSGSVAEVPASLLSLLKVGGRLSAIVGFEPMMRATLVTRVAEDAWRTTQAWDTVAPRLLNFPEPSKFSF